MNRLPAPAQRRIALLLLPVLLTGCGGTPLGESLSRSFSAAPPPAPAVPEAAGAPAPRIVAPTRLNPREPTPAQAQGTGSRPGAGPAPGGTPAGGRPAGKAPPAATPAPAPGSPLRAGGPPMPYRVTLRLPNADPSAPAEGLTEALRAAGVTFEVETIERLPAGTSAPVPTAPEPAATPPSATTPSQRPAPPPR